MSRKEKKSLLCYFVTYLGDNFSTFLKYFSVKWNDCVCVGVCLAIFIQSLYLFIDFSLFRVKKHNEKISPERKKKGFSAIKLMSSERNLNK